MVTSGGCYKRLRAAVIAGIVLTVILIVSSLPASNAAFTPCRLTDPVPSSKSKGVFLVADKHITGSIFMESVILLMAYDRNGAMGVIINKPSEINLSSVFPDIKGLMQRKDFLYVGGPVALKQLLILVQSVNLPEASRKLFDNVYLSSDTTALRSIVNGPKGDDRFHVYAGYAGWSPGQLENEVSRGDWHVVEADSTVIFNKPASSVWQELNKIQPSLEVKAGVPH